MEIILRDEQYGENGNYKNICKFSDSIRTYDLGLVHSLEGIIMMLVDMSHFCQEPLSRTVS